MKSSIKAAIENQGTHELAAANAYMALAFWCEDNDYNGYAKFFYQQEKEEREHAEKFFKHILDRGEMPLVATLSAPTSDFPSLVEVAEAALALEQANTKAITEVYELALAEKDYLSQPMLLEFLAEQVEEEDWAETMVTKTKRAQCSGAILYLDRHIVKELTE